LPICSSDEEKKVLRHCHQNFLEPLHHTQSKDLKEVLHHRKKLQGRKLDFDCKKRMKASDEEIKISEDKFAESLHLAQVSILETINLGNSWIIDARANFGNSQSGK
jgi:BAR domain